MAEGFTVDIVETVRRARSVWIEDATDARDAAAQAESGFGELLPGGHENVQSREAFRISDDSTGEPVPKADWR
jgi:hypothetical protein